MADVIHNISAYALLEIVSNAKNAGGYVVQIPLANNSKATSYSLHALHASIPRGATYAVLANPSIVAAARAHIMMTLAASVTTTLSYVLLRTFLPPMPQPALEGRTNTDVNSDEYGSVDDDGLGTVGSGSGLNLNVGADGLDMAASFIERRFPEWASYGSKGGPGFKTSVFTLNSGHATTMAEWDRLRARYTVDFDEMPGIDIAEIEDFFYTMRGKALGFRFKDWADYQLIDQNMFVGDGKTKNFRLFKRYQNGPNFFDRILTKIVRDSVQNLSLDGDVLVNRRDYFINNNTGVITFVVPPPQGSVVHIDYLEYDVPVRFDDDQLNVSYDEHDALTLSLDLIEILI